MTLLCHSPISPGLWYKGVRKTEMVWLARVLVQRAPSGGPRWTRAGWD